MHGSSFRMLWSWILLAGTAVGCGAEDAREQERAQEVSRRPPNVLFVIVDDLRPALGCFGDERAITPHIDRLAAEGVVFRRAYCQLASCAPSRATVLSGLRPETHGVIRRAISYRTSRPDLVALPELFLRAGYWTAALGKVHHGLGALDDLRAWSDPPWRPPLWQRHYGSEETRSAAERLAEEARAEEDPIETQRTKHFAWEAPEVGDEELGDGMIAAKAIELLEAHRDRPFFLAVGFLKPHLPFVAPRRYWDLYPAGSLAPDPQAEAPEGAPSFALTRSEELRAFWNVPDEGDFDAETRAKLVHGYYACTSYVDAQVGRLLDALVRLELEESTIVVLWGDHGWHLGDLGLWGKHTNYERAVRSPLVVRVPGAKARGAHSDALVELVDLYPTLAELCGLDAPADLEGASFAPLLEEPGAPWKRAVFHLFSRAAPEVGDAVGRAVRTERWRLVEWRAPERDIRALELYDYAGPGERQNLADRPESAEVLAELSALLEAGWRAALPPARASPGAER